MNSPGPVLTRALRLRAATLANENATLVPDPNIDDCHEVYGDGPRPRGHNIIHMFPEVKTTCLHPAKWPAECVYGPKDNFRRCIWCLQPSGLDR